MITAGSDTTPTTIRTTILNAITAITHLNVQSCLELNGVKFEAELEGKATKVWGGP